MDIIVYKNGVHGDTSVMGCIGKVDDEIKKLIEINQFMLYECIKICKPGVKYNKIGELCQKIADDHGYEICDLFTGHGIGEILHLPPTVHHTCFNILLFLIAKI
jgi:methionyl aminopeptidase